MTSGGRSKTFEALEVAPERCGSATAFRVGITDYCIRLCDFRIRLIFRFVLTHLWGTQVGNMQNINPLKNALFAGIATVILSGSAMAADAGDGAGYPIPPAAEEASPWDIAFGVTIASSYVARGVDFTNGLAVQPFAELTVGIFYLGYWGSNLGAFTGDSWEHDVSVGIRPELGPLGLDLGYVHYFLTPNTGDAGGEVYLKAEVSPMDPLTLGAGFWYGTGAINGATYAEVNASLDLIENFAASAAVGWIGGTATPYTTWNAGLTWTPVEQLEIDFRYHNAPAAAPGGALSKFVVSATVSSSLRALGVIH